MNREEKKTVAKMIYVYCNTKHGTSQTLCAKCESIKNYAMKRLEYCKFGESKPTCQKCPVHCYAPEKKTYIQEIMRFSGPRMLFKSPVLAIKHLIKGFKRKAY